VIDNVLIPQFAVDLWLDNKREEFVERLTLWNERRQARRMKFMNW
jgi:hypothetical protein